MPSFQSRIKLDLAQQKSLDSSEYILSLYSAPNPLNYPTVYFYNTDPKKTVFIEKISVSDFASTAGTYSEICAPTNIGTIVNPVESNGRLYNKNTINNPQIDNALSFFNGEITPANYNARVLGYPLFRQSVVDASLISTTHVIDLSNSNIILRPPAVGLFNYISCTLTSNDRIFVTIEFKQFIDSVII